MVSQGDLEVRALSYLMTAVTHRLHETDPSWWNEFLDDMRADRKSARGDDAQVLDRAIGIVEYALKPQPVPGNDG
jgi:hypothetical protein